MWSQLKKRWKAIRLAKELEAGVAKNTVAQAGDAGNTVVQIIGAEPASEKSESQMGQSQEGIVSATFTPTCHFE